MLNNVAGTVGRLARQVILNHPNAFGGFVLRKRVIRPAPDTIGGLPTLGGLAVLDSEDEAEFVLDVLGNVAAMRAELFAGAPLFDRQDATAGQGAEFRFLIEPEEGPGMPGNFQPKSHDILCLVLGEDFQSAPKVAYEVVGVESTSDLPPFTPRYVCNRRAELDML